MTARRSVAVEQRRRRLTARHHLGRTAQGVEEAVRSLVAVHSSDPLTPYLALQARVAGFTAADLDRALYEQRRLWRLHAMRRTLFVVHVEAAPTVLAAASREIARVERRKLERWVDEALDGQEASGWLRRVERKALELLADGRPRSTRDLGTAIEELTLPLQVGSGKWTATTPLSTRLLSLLALDGQVVRSAPAGSWRSSQYGWADRAAWFGDDIALAGLDVPAVDARAGLARSYLAAHGPATTADLRWWTGWGAKATAAALSTVGAVEVDLDDGAVGWVLPDDLDLHPRSAEDSEVALLPSLDPTVMGWKQRHWYLGAHRDLLFDRNGNAGPTVWADGRIIGGWGLSARGEVIPHLLEDVGRETGDAVFVEAAALTAWLQGEKPIPRFRTPLERRLSSQGE